MSEAQIEFKDGPGPWQPWAVRVGTRSEIEKSARGLLAEIREEYPRGQVSIVDGRGKRRRVRLNGGGEAEEKEAGRRPRVVSSSPLTVRFENPLA